MDNKVSKGKWLEKYIPPHIRGNSEVEKMQLIHQIEDQVSKETSSNVITLRNRKELHEENEEKKSIEKEQQPIKTIDLPFPLKVVPTEKK